MKLKTIITNFVNKLALVDLNLVYFDYENGDYDHLLSSPRQNLTAKQKREVLINYLESFIIDGDYENDERPTILNNIVTENNVAGLIHIICNDQFYSEPLFRSMAE